ncbi:Outer-membrane-phospholipid-binding lipoprotein MlaA [hydrothermal vent metagenome]|uniref:Outer-membrane-phospholipid-binding lipoprotein MlaA n=1 Tax=hydrothermal vent metagenome TaxID=652676 RepID=A0A3B1AU01_9ZZZZ
MNIKYLKLITLLLSIFASSCATVSAPDERDPWESMNRSIYSFNDGFDRAIGRPVAEAYQFILPDVVETGISNFFSNLNDVVVIVNDLLQFKFLQAASDFTRLLINSTFGLLGIFDIATQMEVPKHDEDFGQTLATWGVGDGAYLVLPLLGPSSVRDTTGLIFDAYYLLPITYVNDDEVRWGLIALAAVDKRASLLEASRILEKSGVDPYVFVRDAYYQVRQNQIYDGNPPTTRTFTEPTADDLLLEDELEKELQLQ